MCTTLADTCATETLKLRFQGKHGRGGGKTLGASRTVCQSFTESLRHTKKTTKYTQELSAKYLFEHDKHNDVIN